MFIIDFEASSLRKSSHPIEVAWGCRPDAIESYLLNPDCMAGWTDWNTKSFEFHGITPEQLRQHGHDPRKVAGKMVSDLAGQPVYSDEPHFDIRWKNRLLADSGYDPSRVKILDLNTWVARMARTPSANQSVNDLVCTFECSQNSRHRAAADVFWLLEFVNHVRQNC